MQIVITRYRKKSETACTEPVEVIDGRLTIEGIHICDTAENAITALKAGTYPVVVQKCKYHKRKMPVVMVNGKDSLTSHPSSLTRKCSACPKLPMVCNNTTLPCYCPMLKPGNGVYHREDGSIILGQYIAPGCLIHPKEAFETLYDRIRKTLERGNQVTLTITEDYPPERHSLTNFELGQQILKHF